MDRFCAHCGSSVEELRAHREEVKERAKITRKAHEEMGQVKQIAWFYGIVLALNFLGAYGAEFLFDFGYWSLLILDLSLIGTTLVWMRVRPELLDGRLGMRFPVWVLPAMLLMAFVTFGVAFLLDSAVMYLLGLNEIIENTQGREAFMDLDVPPVILIITICVVPAIFEELFFRGLVQGCLEKALSKREAWIVQAIIFAIAHVNLIGFFTYLVFLGLYLGWLRNRFQSLLPAMVAHLGHNFLAVTIQYLTW